MRRNIGQLREALNTVRTRDVTGRVLGRLPDWALNDRVVDTRGAHMTPLYHPFSHLAYAAHGSDVLHTVVDGRVVYRDGRLTTIDLDAVRAEVAALAPAIAAAVQRL